MICRSATNHTKVFKPAFLSNFATQQANGCVQAAQHSAHLNEQYQEKPIENSEAPHVCTDQYCIQHKVAYFAAASMDAPASTNNPGNQKPSCHFPLSSPYSRMPHRPATNSPHCMTGYAMDKPTCGSVVAMMEHMLPRFQQVPEAMPGRAACLECREGQGPCCTITRMAVTIGAAISTPAKHKHLLQHQKQF